MEDVIDKEFGAWIRAKRINAGVSVAMACKKADIDVRRLLELEHGIARKGITKIEAFMLSHVYGLEPDAIEAFLVGMLN